MLNMPLLHSGQLMQKIKFYLIYKKVHAKDFSEFFVVRVVLQTG